MPWTRFTGRFCSLRVLADGLNSKESHYAASPPNILHSICDTALGRCGRAGGMLPLSVIYSTFCAVSA